MIEARICGKDSAHSRCWTRQLSIENGESVAVIGRSGCGKSVLLKAPDRLLPPDAGEALIDGENIVPMNERQLLRVRPKFAWCFKVRRVRLDDVAENVAFGLRRHEHLTEPEIARVCRSLRNGGFARTENKQSGRIVRAHAQARGTARAIIYEPQIVLYDEPTTGLDPIASDSIDQLMARVRDQLKGDDGGGHARHAHGSRIGQRVLMMPRQKDLRERPGG